MILSELIPVTTERKLNERKLYRVCNFKRIEYFVSSTNNRVQIIGFSICRFIVVLLELLARAPHSR